MTTTAMTAQADGRPVEEQPALEFDLPGTCRLFGYARVSTKTQDVRRQLAQLRQAGVPEANIRTETTSGASRRPVLDQLLADLKAGDVLVVTELDRLGRNGASLVAMVGTLDERDIGLRLLCPAVDTTDPLAGPIIRTILAVLADAERRLMIERTRTGLAAAKAAGRRGGRPSVMTTERLKVAHQLIANGATIAEAARTIGVSRPTLSKHLAGSPSVC